MTTEDLIKHAGRIADEAEKVTTKNEYMVILATACDFLSKFGGPKNSFLKAIFPYSSAAPEWGGPRIAAALRGFAKYYETGLGDGITPEKKAQLAVVSDLLSQANDLLEKKGIHPAAPAVIIGATLEEFLRNWVEESKDDGLTLKASIDIYLKYLYDNNKIDKQDVKDITAWAGIRNDAAHGHWDKVESKEKISLMLQGVNLFMRKYENRG